MSREKQIEEMRNIMETDCDRPCAGCELENEEHCFTHNCAIRIYNAGYRKQEWISVDERLPEIEGDARTWGELKIRKSVRVLCACVQKSGKTFVKEGYCEVWGDSQRSYWKIPGSIDKVTHWMPLPEPPKMKGGAE